MSYNAESAEVLNSLNGQQIMETHGSVVPSTSGLTSVATAHLVRHQTVGRTLPEETPGFSFPDPANYCRSKKNPHSGGKLWFHRFLL